MEPVTPELALPREDTNPPRPPDASLAARATSPNLLAALPASAPTLANKEFIRFIAACSTGSNAIIIYVVNYIG